MSFTRRMTVRQAADYFEQLPGRLQAEFAWAFHTSLSDALAHAQGLSSGPYTLHALRQMYNPRGPYSTAAPHPPDDPAIINVQSGRFRRAWRTESILSFESGKARGVVMNDAPEVRYLKGTRKMIARPILNRLAAEMRPVIIDRFTEAVERAVK